MTIDISQFFQVFFDEAEELLAEKERLLLAVDIAALCLRDGRLNALLIRREDAQLVGGDWAMPGAFVHQGKPLDDAIARAAQVKAGLGAVHLEQLASYGDPGRYPRGHVVSITYLAIAPAPVLAAPVLLPTPTPAPAPAPAPRPARNHFFASDEWSSRL